MELVVFKKGSLVAWAGREFILVEIFPDLLQFKDAAARSMRLITREGFEKACMRGDVQLIENETSTSSQGNKRS